MIQSGSMSVAVILCTYNRAKSLHCALASLSAQSPAEAFEWEVVVVDNNSSDDTRQVVEDFCLRFPGRYRYIFEPHQGKSFALNRGLKETTSDVIAFVDDDVEVAENWLSRLAIVLKDERWAGVGGRILPEEGFQPPTWLDTESRHILAPLAIFDRGAEARELGEPPFGTNMAFRRTVFAKHGGFRTDLGPQPGSEIRGDDTEFGNRLLKGGERLWYEPSAVVYHPVSPQRLRRGYFLTWWHDKGRADVRELGVQGRSTANIGDIPLVLFGRLGVAGVRWLCSFQKAKRFSYKLRVWGILGAIKECYSSTKPNVRANELNQVE